MADKIISFGFTPGPPTNKDLEPKQIAQPVQRQNNFAETVAIMALVLAIVLALILFAKNLRQGPGVSFAG